MTRNYRANLLLKYLDYLLQFSIMYSSWFLDAVCWLIGIIKYKICTLNFICTCRIHHLIEMIRKDPLANLFFVCERYNPMTVTADAPASRIDKKKSSPETCNFFLPNRFHLTLILEPQRRNACPIVLLPRNSCIITFAFFQL